MKLSAAGADCKRCLDVQSSLVKELCLWIRVDRDQRRLERRQDLQLKLLREVPIQIGIGRYACMVLSPSHAKLSACVQPIKAAIMRHGSTWISSIGAIPGHITKNLTDEFNSKSVLHHIITGSRKGTSAIS